MDDTGIAFDRQAARCQEQEDALRQSQAREHAIAVQRDNLLADVARLEAENRRLEMELAALLRHGIGVASRDW